MSPRASACATKVVPGIGPVDRDEILKGYEVSKGEYVLLDPEEIEKVKLESRKTLELTQFVELTDIDPIYYDKPYYVVPGRRPRRGSVCRRPRRAQEDQQSRHRPARHARPGICGEPETVRPRHCWRRCAADEVHKASSYFRDIGDAKPDADLLEMAETLIEKKASDFDAKEFENRYIDALKKLIAEKQKKKGKRIIQDDEPDRIPKGSNVIDLMAALKKSLGDDKKPAARRPAASAAPPSRLPPRSAKKTATRARKRA